MADNTFGLFIDFLSENGIKIVDTANSEQSLYDVVEDHIKLIGEFHRKTKGYNFYVSKGINNNIGKAIEKNKIEIKKLNRYLEEQEEDLIYKKVKNVLSRAENSVKEAQEANYLGLINRSMANLEICIGNSLPSNLKRDNGITVVSLKNCCYDMLEMDGIYYFSKLRRKDRKLDWYRLVKFYCNEEGLDTNSEKYMLALLSFPEEALKCFNKYRLSKTQCNKEKFLRKLEKAIIKDGQSLI